MSIEIKDKEKCFAALRQYLEKRDSKPQGYYDGIQESELAKRCDLDLIANRTAGGKTGTMYLAKHEYYEMESACYALDAARDYLNPDEYIIVTSDEGIDYEIWRHKAGEYLWNEVTQISLPERIVPQINHAIAGVSDALGSDDVALARIHFNTLAGCLLEIGMIQP
jgi:hypothetical protein